MYTQFWVKTLLNYAVPGGWGYVRSLRKYRDVAYDHARDKHSVRNKHNGQAGWKNVQQDNFSYRDYASYDEYITHQKQKFIETLKLQGGFSSLILGRFRRHFFSVFKHLFPVLPKDAMILCLGARQGTEVEVLRDCGYKNSIGIDLYPGPGNPFVQEGDFMRTNFKDSTFDMVYSNALDHAFNLNDAFLEHARILKPDGYAVYEFKCGVEGGAFEALSWQRDEDLVTVMLKHFKTLEQVFRRGEWKCIVLKSKA